MLERPGPLKARPLNNYEIVHALGASNVSRIASADSLFLLTEARLGVRATFMHHVIFKSKIFSAKSRLENTKL